MRQSKLKNIKAVVTFVDCNVTIVPVSGVGKIEYIGPC